ncbi:MAG: diguanylate cyclase, partial [Phycisphaerae bacterium]|nr:diguanylate cyclase [Phycisphaerae bacterium]
MPLRGERSRWLAATALALVMLSAGAATPDQARSQRFRNQELTEAERRWLQAHPVIRLGPYANYAPAQFVDDEGNHRGLAADYCDIIQNTLGIRFELVHTPTWAAMLDKAKGREIDLIALAADTPQRRRYLSFTEPYLDLPAVLIVGDSVEGTIKPDELQGKKVAVTNGYAVQEYLARKYPDLDLHPVPDTVTGLRDVSFGKVDVFVSDLAVASHYIHKEAITNLRIAGESGYVYRMGFAARSDWPMLQQILDKALAAIGSAQREELFSKWVRLEESPPLVTARMIVTFLAVLVMVGLILGAVLGWNRVLRHKVAQRTRELEDVNTNLEQTVETRTEALATANQGLRREVLDRRQAQALLAESQERLGRVTDAIPGAVYQFKLDADGGQSMTFMSAGLQDLYGIEAEKAVADFDAMWNMALSEDHPRIAESITESARTMRPWACEYRIRSADGRLKWIRGNSIPQEPRPDGSIVFNGLLTDVTAAKEAEAQVEARVREQAAVASLGQLALGGMDLDRLLREVVTVVAKTIDVEFCHVLEWQKEDNTVHLKAGVGWGSEQVGQAHGSAAIGTQASYTLHSAEPVIVEDLAREQRFTPDPLLCGQGMVAGIEVPIAGAGGPLGVLGIYDDDAHRFSDNDVHFLQAVANLLAEGIQRRDNERELENAALKDGLTGLPNRILLLDRLTQALRRRRRNPDYHFAVLFLDIDRFKIINDSLGHEAGDQLLLGIAERMNEQLRDTDTVAHADSSHMPARLGGDEFVVLLDGVRSTQDAALVAERMQENLSRPYRICGQEVCTSASIGIVTSDGDYENADDILRDADTAMYQAKNSGKARHMIFDQQMHQQVLSRLNLEKDLRQAVEQEQFILQYEPTVNLEEGILIGVEGRIRWPRPAGAMVMPDIFLPIAEETGLVIPIGEQVLREGCRQLRAWHEQHPDRNDFTLTINLTRRQLILADLLEQV